MLKQAHLQADLDKVIFFLSLREQLHLCTTPGEAKKKKKDKREFVNARNQKPPLPHKSVAPYPS